MLSHFLSLQSNLVGIVGVALVLYAYFMLQISKMLQTSVIFSLLNFLGSVFILISLYYHWNLASGIIEVAWLMISLYGLIRSLLARRFVRNSR